MSTTNSGSNRPDDLDRFFERRRRWRNVKQVALMGTGLISSYWLLHEVIDGHSSWKVWGGIVVGAFGVAVLIQYVIGPAVVRKFSQQVIRDVQEKLMEIDEISYELAKNNRVLELHLMLWRLESELTKFKAIEDRHWTIESFQDYQYIREIFGRVLSKLGEGAIYRTLSNMNFWSEDSVAGDTRFIDFNYDAITRGGVQVERTILIFEEALRSVREERYHKNVKAVVRINEDLELRLKAYTPSIPEGRYKLDFYVIKDMRPLKHTVDSSPMAVITMQGDKHRLCIRPEDLLSDRDLFVSNPVHGPQMKNPKLHFLLSGDSHDLNVDLPSLPKDERIGVRLSLADFRAYLRSLGLE